MYCSDCAFGVTGRRTPRHLPGPSRPTGEGTKSATARPAALAGREVLDTLRTLERLSCVYQHFGRYDIVDLLRALDLHAASEVAARIRPPDSGVSTEMLVVRATR
jgi:hypothetical protein